MAIKKEGITYEQRDLNATQTRLPSHTGPLSLFAVSEVLNAEQPGLIGVQCASDFPSEIEGTVDHGIMTECHECKAIFVWVDRTQTWCPT